MIPIYFLRDFSFIQNETRKQVPAKRTEGTNAPMVAT